VDDRQARSFRTGALPEREAARDGCLLVGVRRDLIGTLHEAVATTTGLLSRHENLPWHE
jgi:hypothetical protein